MMRPQANQNPQKQSSTMKPSLSYLFYYLHSNVQISFPVSFIEQLIQNIER